MRTAVWEAPGGLGAQLAAAATTGHQKFLAQLAVLMGVTTGRFTEPEERANPRSRETARVPAETHRSSSDRSGLRARMSAAVTRHDDPEDPIYFVLMHDPEGNEFCVG